MVASNPNVIANVGGAEIFVRELDQYNDVIRKYEPFMAKMNEKQREEFTAGLKKQILFRIINDKLILQEAKKSGMAISEEIVQSILEKNPQLMKKDHNKADLANLVTEIENNTMSQFVIDLLKEARINSDVLTQKFAEAQSAERELVEISVDLTKIQPPTITEEEIQSYYKQHQNELKTQELRSFSYVEITARDSSTFKEVHDLINKLEDELASGATLIELQKKFNLEVKKTALITERQFKGEQEIVDFAFSSDAGPNARFMQFVHKPGYFAVSIDKIQESEQIVLDKVREEIIKNVKTQKTYELALAKAHKLLNEFKLDPNKILQSSDIKIATSIIKLSDERLNNAAIADYMLYKNNPSDVMRSVNSSPGFAFIQKIAYKKLDQNSLEVVKKQTEAQFLDIIYSQFLEYLKNRHKITLY